MSDRRQGLNCTLSYMRGKTRSAYRVRANLLTHGMTVLFDESQARVRKAFYPHRLTSAQFMVGIELVGDGEHTSFTNWMASYADFILDPDLRFGEFPSMAVSIPSRGFLRKGVPLTGYGWEDAVGKMVWSPALVFETAGEPGEKSSVALSRVTGIAMYDRDVKYFYPTGTQLGGSDTPPDGTYTTTATIEDILPPAPTGTNANGGRSLRGGTTKD